MSLLRLSFQALLVVAAGTGLGAVILWWGSERLGGDFVSLIWAGVLCLSVGIISLVPLRLAAKHGGECLSQAYLAGTGLRFLLTLSLGMLVYNYFMESSQKVAFALWTLVFYLLLLVWETLTALRLVKNFYPSSAGGRSN